MEMIFWILILLNLIIGISLLTHKKYKKSEAIIMIGLPLLLVIVYYYYGCDAYMKGGLIGIFQEIKSGMNSVYITLLILMNLFLLTFVNIGKVVGD